MELKTVRGGMFYGSLFLMTLLCGGLGTLLLFVAMAQETTDYGMLAFTAFFYFMGIYAIVKFWKNTPIVRMSDEGLRYRGRRYGWSQIKYANFTRQRPFPTIGKSGKVMDAITLAFDDGNELHLFDEVYWNANEIRNYLQGRVKADLTIQHRADSSLQHRTRGTKPDVTQDEETKKRQKRKMNWFIFFYMISVLLITSAVVFFELSKGAEAVVLIIYNIVFAIVFIKMFRRKKVDGQGNS